MTDPQGPFMAAVGRVIGPPKVDTTITIGKASSGQPFYSARHIYLRQVRRSVLAHEIAHAVHDSGAAILGNRVWEEGMARAAEVDVMRLLAQQGILEPGYDFRLGYATYYENSNRGDDVGAPNGDIYGEPGIQLLRYEMSGYAFGKILIENPRFVVDMNALLFARAGESPGQSELLAMAASVQPSVEGQRLSDWAAAQGIFETAPPGGCRLLQRVSQFTVDFFCRQNGIEVPESGANVSFKVYDWQGNVVFEGSDVTAPLGWVTFSPLTHPSMGRLRMVASASAVDGQVSSTYYRQSGPEEGIFGVVTNADSGTVSFSSPTGAFPALSVPVINGAFSAPSLTPLRGQIHVTYSGPTGSADRIVNKDIGPYSMVITSRAPPPPGQPTPPATVPPALPPPSQPPSTGRPDAAGNLSHAGALLEHPPRAGRLVIKGRAKAAARAGKAFRRKLKVLALRSTGQPAAGVKVTCALPARWGKFANGRRKAVARTNAAGVTACPKLTARRKTGRVKLTASAVGYGEVKFTLTVKRTRRSGS